MIYAISVEGLRELTECCIVRCGSLEYGPEAMLSVDGVVYATCAEKECPYKRGEEATRWTAGQEHKPVVIRTVGYDHLPSDSGEEHGKV